MAKLKKQLKNGVSVEVLKGKDAKRTGVVKSVDWNSGRVIVEKVNMQKRHIKPNQQNRAGGIIDQEGSIAISNLRVVEEVGKAKKSAAKDVESTASVKEKSTKKMTKKAATKVK